jgi:hypothetical protein
MRTGGCQCGAVRFTVGRDKLHCYACHCSQCQKQSASAFGLSVPVRQAEFKVEGALNYWSRSTFSGGRTDCYFCPDCGSRVFHAGRAGGEFVTVKGGAFDDAVGLEPVAHIWTSMKLPWTRIPADVPSFETQPPDLDAWRRSFFGTDG